MSDCKHTKFVSQNTVTRLTESEQSNVVTGYMLDVKVKCDECGLPFEFIGLPGGYSPAQPMGSADMTEARMPIRPSTDPVEHANVILK